MGKIKIWNVTRHTPLQGVDKFGVTGVIRFREIPLDWDDKTYRYWWLGEFDDSGRMIRKPRMSDREKDRYQVAEYRNILTTAGRAALLAFVGSTGSTNGPFGKIFSLGTFPIISVSPGDTGVNTEVFRKQPATAVVTGTQIDIATAIGTTEAVGTLSNAGLYGTTSATTTFGTGTLYTHALLQPYFVKANGAAYTADYLISLT